MSDNPICSVCGTEMDDYSGDVWYCPECGNKAYSVYGDSSGTIYQAIDEISEDYDETNKPRICKSCSEDDYYPACMATCPAFNEPDYYIDD